MLPTLLAAVSLGGLASPDVSRWEVHSQLVLPRPMWLLEGDVLQVRVTEVALDLELSCASEDDSPEVSCILTDVAIRAAAMPGDEAHMDLALAQADERLTGAEVSLVLKQGRITQLGLKMEGDQPRIRRTTRARDENLRLLVSRALAGFDLQEGDLDGEGVWGQRRTWLAQMPSGRGTRAAGSMVHELHVEEGAHRVVSQGKITMAVDMLTNDGRPVEDDTFRGEVRAEAHLTAEGQLQRRRWALQVDPTASSALADGPAGLPYIHTGRLERLTDGPAAIGSTRTVAATHRQPSALQSSRYLGVPPGAWQR